MIRLIRLFSLAIICCCFLAGLLISKPVLLIVSPGLRARLLSSSTSIWARIMLKVMGIRVSQVGPMPSCSDEPFLLVSNHQSYLDMLIISAVFPAAFIAKSEVGSWPLIGWLSRLAPTVFIRRKDSLSNVQGFYKVCKLLRQGVNVQVFPEGTTSDGTEVLKFNELFFASAIRTGRRILPLTINFLAVNGARPDRKALDLLSWYGEMDFFSHFWKLLAIDSSESSLVIQKPISIEKYSRAVSVARVAEVIVKSQFDSPISQAIAEMPVEFAPASAANGPVEPALIADEPISDFLIGAILYSLLESNLNETIYDMIPQREG